MKPILSPDAGQIDTTDERVKSILCLLCNRLLYVERGSRLDKENLCDACSRRTDVIANIIGVQ